MLRSLVVLAAVLAFSDAAVLVRFISTVPNPLDVQAIASNGGNGRIGSEQYQLSRVGLQYFAVNNAGSTQSPTLVWTQPENNRDADVAAPTGTAPYAWLHAMPTLRAYHALTYAPSVVPMVDRIAAYLSTQVDPVTSSPYAALSRDPSVADNYEQTTLKADGVSLYLSFAAGTYQMQAYVAMSSTSAAGVDANLPIQISSSQTSMTFADGAVYTIIATGNGAFTASSPTTGNTIGLTMIQESTAPTTFGMASLRWFHAIYPQSTAAISVYQGSSATANQIVSSVSYKAVSSYVDVAPKTSQVFTLSVPNSDGTPNVIAPSTASSLEVTHDLRAGMRATIICGQADTATATIFCRMIPSRVVAYVRLINDLAGQTALVQGAFGSVALNTAKLTLWASYEFPRPDQVYETSQDVGSNIVPVTPALSRGLYGVVSAVAAGSCSGYGEVFVPLLIMDYAVRYTVIRDDAEYAWGTATGTYLTAGLSNQQAPATTTGTTIDNKWFWGATVFKRVNFVLKTDGYSTLSGIPTYSPVRDLSLTANFAAGYYWYTNAMLLDNYMEPGQYYSLIVGVTYNPTAGTPALPYVPSSMQSPASTSFYWRLDRSIDLLSAGVGSGKGVVNVIGYGVQQLGTSSFNLRLVGSNNVIITTAIPTTTLAVPDAIAGVFPGWNAATADLITANAGQYTFDQSSATTVTNGACITRIPGSTTININSGDMIDVYVLNGFGCYTASNNVNNLAVTVCKAQSAVATNNAVNTLLTGTSATAAPGTSFFVGAAPTLSSSLTLVLLAILAVVAALF